MVQVFQKIALKTVHCLFICKILPVKVHFFSLRQAEPSQAPPGIRIESIYV